MKSDTRKLLIQVISVLLFSIIVFYLLLPIGVGNMGEILLRFIKRHLLICMIGLLISDIIIMRRPRFVAATSYSVAGCNSPIKFLSCWVRAAGGASVGVIAVSTDDNRIIMNKPFYYHLWHVPEMPRREPAPHLK